MLIFELVFFDVPQSVCSSGATGWTGGLVPPFLTETNFLIRPNPVRMSGGGGTVGFINVSRSNKYTCRVYEKLCVQVAL